MKIILVFILLVLSTFALSSELNCHYLDHKNKKGVVVILVSENYVELNFKNKFAQASECVIDKTENKITAECEKENQSIGIILERKNSRFEGIIMSEKAQVFAKVNC